MPFRRNNFTIHGFGRGVERRAAKIKASVWLQGNPTMKTVILAGSVALTLLLGAASADAKGCLKGAVVGGVAGHFAGHHALLGAAAGCAIGHHMAHRHDRRDDYNGHHHRLRHS